MVCYHPITVMYPAVEDSDGKRRLVFSESSSKKGNIITDDPYIRDFWQHDIVNGYKIKIPCGKCIGCRLDYSRQWALRAVNESMLHKDNTFVTLTFDDDHLPDNRSVSKSYMSSWMKRFRKKFGEDIRFMMCGEYGDKFQRPHYHILFFNFKFPDQKYWSQRRGQIYYRSKMLEEVWRDACSSTGNGFSCIGDVTFESAAYVGRYVTKKFDGALADHKYKGREKEFLHVSRMPGLGHDFIIKNYQEILNRGFCVLPNGHKAQIPRYYLDIVSQINPDVYKKFKLDRTEEMINNLFVEDLDSTQQRLEAREELHKLKLDKLVRCYEFNPVLHNI